MVVKKKKKLKTKDTSTKTADKPVKKVQKVEEKRTVVPTVVSSGTALTVADAPALNAEKALARAKELYRGVERSFLVWAAVLYEIKEKGHYSEAGYTTYKDYVEGEFKVSVRSAQNKVETYKALCLDHQVEPDVLEQIGHNKGLLIKQALEKGIKEKKDLPDLIDTALKSTEKELKSVINGAKKPSEPGKPGQTLEGDEGKQPAWDFNTRVTSKSGIEIVQQAKAKMDASEGKEVSMAMFLERLAMEYLASTIHKSKKPISYYQRLLKEAYPEYHLVAVHKKHAAEFQALSQKLMSKDAPKEDAPKEKNAVPKKMKKKVDGTKSGKPKVKKEA